MHTKPSFYLALAVIVGLIGFGGYFFGEPSLLDVSVVFPPPLDRLFLKFSRLASVVLLLFFAGSLWLEKKHRVKRFYGKSDRSHWA